VLAKKLLAVAVTVFAMTACAVDKTSAPGLTGPSGLGLSLDVTASPDVLVRDSVSTSTIEIVARDGNGNVIPNLGLQDVASVNLGTLSAGSIKTNSAGKATTTYTAPGQGGTTTCTITVTPTGSNFQNTQPRTITIRLFQAL